MDKIQFEGNLAQTQSAIKISGKEGSARIQIDIPASYKAEIAKLSTYCTEKVLRVTIEVEE